MRSLLMRWDEQVYGLEYDLDLYNIVAVPRASGNPAAPCA